LVFQAEAHPRDLSIRHSSFVIRHSSPMTPIPHLARHLAGRHPLPAGAVPLASDKPGSLVCMMPCGRWIRWWPGTRSIEPMPPETSKAVAAMLVEHLGGTSARAAVGIGVSTRTVEAWRSGRAKMALATALRIAELLARAAPVPDDD
jgi:DNA-binding XRE family transcriptional regulator